MSPMEQQELIDIVEGMSSEEQRIVASKIQDPILWNELINRYVENRDALAKVRNDVGA